MNGWVCPRCQRIFAPSVKECPVCNEIDTALPIEVVSEEYDRWLAKRFEGLTPQNSGIMGVADRWYKRWEEAVCFRNNK